MRRLIVYVDLQREVTDEEGTRLSDAIDEAINVTMPGALAMHRACWYLKQEIPTTRLGKNLPPTQSDVRWLQNNEVQTLKEAVSAAGEDDEGGDEPEGETQGSG